MSKIIQLSQINASHYSLIGNKAFRLSELHKANIQTADFFVIPTSSSKLDEKLETEILHNLQSDNPNTHYAVRSSATCEDGVSASFAGQFSSYLSLSQDEVIPSIRKCWESAKSESVMEYCQYHLIDPKIIKMAVIVQHMVFADKGGVMFTRDVFQNRDTIVIEATNGLGEQVVSGTVDSDKYVLNKQTGKVIEGVLGFKQSVLTKPEVNQLYKLAKQIEKLFDSPQDIEWAIHQSKLFVLQSRPIT